MAIQATIANLRNLLTEKVALKRVMPNLHMPYAIHVCLPVIKDAKYVDRELNVIQLNNI